MSQTYSRRTRYLGLLGAVAGASFLVYAAVKGPLTAEIVREGWRLGGLTHDQTALVVHVAEELPLVVMALGLVGLHRHLDRSEPLDGVGVGIALAGFGLTVLTHLGEHLLAPVTVQALFGDENLFVWSYYLSWLVLYVGFALYGVAVLRYESGPAWLGGTFVVLLPGVVLVGLAAVVLDVFTLAGTFRLGLGGTWLVVGAWLWRVRTGPVASHPDETVGRVDPDRR